MIVQMTQQQIAAEDNYTRCTMTPLILSFYNRGRNLSWHNSNKRERTEVISDNLSQLCYCTINGDCLNRKASRLLGKRPMNIRQGNGASVVVRAGESPVHGEGKQLIN